MSHETKYALIGKIAALLALYGLDKSSSLDAARTIVLVAIPHSRSN